MKAKRRTSDALVELRTVATRAETALELIRGLPNRRAYYQAQGADAERRRGVPNGTDMKNLTGFWAKLAEDPEEPEMIAALEQVVKLLERWR